MRYNSKFVKVLLWEALENAPMLVGFLLAIRFQSENLMLAIILSTTGAACGALLIHLTETRKYSNQPTLKETLVNFAALTFLPLPFLFYFSSQDVWWSNWVTDILLGVLAGYLLTFGESWGWNSKETVKMHTISMAIASILFLFGIRLTYKLDLFVAIILVGVVLNLFVSVIIVFFDYWPIKTMPQKAEIQTAEKV